MSDEPVIRFGKALPLFPLSAVVLFPHGVLPLHIFEDRYRQMVDDTLDTSGQIAMAVYASPEPGSWTHDAAPLRPVVCIGQILQHQRLPDGRFNIALQGLLRARIAREIPPVSGRLYRQAIMEPFGTFDPAADRSLSTARERLTSMLSSTPLTHLRDSSTVLKHMANPTIPTSAILELMTLSFINDNDLRYRLLATPDAKGRARLIESELESLARLLRQAQPQMDVHPPKGCSWN